VLISSVARFAKKSDWARLHRPLVVSDPAARRLRAPEHHKRRAAALRAFGPTR
jgi:hypothetical protein